MTSPSPISTRVNRRVALGATAAGALAALTACASDIRHWLMARRLTLLPVLLVHPRALQLVPHPVPRLALRLLLLPASIIRAS